MCPVRVLAFRRIIRVVRDTIHRRAPAGWLTVAVLSTRRIAVDDAARVAGRNPRGRRLLTCSSRFSLGWEPLTAVLFALAGAYPGGNPAVHATPAGVRRHTMLQRFLTRTIFRAFVCLATFQA